MRVGDVLDRSFELLRREWRAAVLLGAGNLVAIGVFFFGFLGFFIALAPSLEDGTIPDDETLIAFAVGMSAFGIVFGIVSLVLTGMSLRAAVHGPEEGTDWGSLLGHAWPAFKSGMRLLGWGLLVGLAMSALMVPIFLIAGFAGFAGEGDAGEALTVLLVLGVMGVIFLAAIFVAPVLMVMTALVYGREAKVWRSIGRGASLVGRSYWPSVGATVILYLFSLVPVIGSLLVAVLTPPFQAAMLEGLEGLEAA